MSTQDQVVLIHGWSAKSSSMVELAKLLKARNYRVSNIFLGDYPSTDDDVKIEDVAERLGNVIVERQSGLNPELAQKFHVIVHSTGALVARLWMARRFPNGQGCPVRNFLMLAPANFGSPLANVGRSMLGRIKAGLGNGFQSGTEVLHGLELGSQLQQDLALMDRLARPGEAIHSPYSVDQTRPYVIVGALQVNGTQILPQTGWDGTVRIASANLNPQGMSVDFSAKAEDPHAPVEIQHWRRRGPEAAFAVIPDRDHLNILKPEKSDAKDPDIRDRLAQMILKALAVNTEAGYEALKSEWTDISNRSRFLAGRSPEAGDARKAVFGSSKARRIPRSRFNEHYQIVMDVRDSAGYHVDDFGVWLSSPRSADKPRVKGRLRRDEIDVASVLQDVHVNRRDRHRQVLHLDRYKLFGEDGYFNEHSNTLLAAISAAPLGNNIDFGLKADEAYGYLPLRSNKSSGALTADDERFLRRYATHFIEVILPRQIGDRAFELKAYG